MHFSVAHCCYHHHLQYIIKKKKQFCKPVSEAAMQAQAKLFCFANFNLVFQIVLPMCCVVAYLVAWPRNMFEAVDCDTFTHTLWKLLVTSLFLLGFSSQRLQAGFSSLLKFSLANLSDVFLLVHQWF